jgi:hypothetical protein
METSNTPQWLYCHSPKLHTLPPTPLSHPAPKPSMRRAESKRKPRKKRMVSRRRAEMQIDDVGFEIRHESRRNALLTGMHDSIDFVPPWLATHVCDSIRPVIGHSSDVVLMYLASSFIFIYSRTHINHIDAPFSAPMMPCGKWGDV